MQTSRLPLSICDKLDMHCRSFVWGSNRQHKRVHLIDWMTLCHPRDNGGLGLKDLRTMNKAFLLKIAWGLLNDEEAFWARVLCAKYNVPEMIHCDSLPHLNGSHLWKSIRSI